MVFGLVLLSTDLTYLGLLQSALVGNSQFLTLSVVTNPRFLLLENLGCEEINDRSCVGYYVCNGDLRVCSGKVSSISCARPETTPVWLGS
ncbi:uncharacterized protein F5891DRAFT_1018403 [Suillus fuscotomentosus]|uniref:Secreted protein n=1 Tax=Suillus fuscotomentosus TaxID=1912939 RepID=A0AAD4HNS7_9AGAM|nr:uncharacterized protein F5891DRAFT_1018403 [Suillus fuscotomentosus]KAG1903282.1 hypothetical protein F5891DRAFT_1018403 [Suillus fuscotomentosus]